MPARCTQMEREIMTEFLELYKDSPCLWSPQHPLYTNKEARVQALDVLLEKYKLLDEDATVDTIRKKIDNLRCAYKREHKRVLASEAEGTGIYKPTLWYYKLLNFLDNQNEEHSTHLNITHSESEQSSQLFEEDYEYDDECIEPPARKQLKTEADHLYIPDLQEDIDGSLVTQSQRDIINDSTSHESEAFGKTIGLQLKELEPMQRFIAEKLISEVIFYGRLHKLNTQTNISLNQDY